MAVAAEVGKKGRVRFGPFELRTDTRELSRSGIHIKLQTKPEQILELLISRPGQLVRREELRSCLWQGNVFVDFESGLNTAVNRLRAVLGDTAETPRYISKQFRASATALYVRYKASPRALRTTIC